MSDLSVHTRIKICGITRPADAAAAAEAGATAVGLNFAAVSPRRVVPERAAVIAREMAGMLLRIGVFVDQTHDEVRTVLDEVELDALQFHGAEPEDFCASFGLPYLKAHRVRGPVDANALRREHPSACGHLLDAYVPDRPGGTGTAFDWRYWPDSSGLKLVLAGGLTAANVAGAIRAVRPYAVDVSGGVEGPVKGEKDAERVRAFIAAVREADAGEADQYDE